MSLNIFIPAHLIAAVSRLDADSALAKLMAKAKHEWLDFPLEALICRYAGIEVLGNGAQSLAAISYFGEAGLSESYAAEFKQPQASGIMFAEPVHLLLQRDSFSLSSPVPLPLLSDETQALLASLNQHFTTDGLQFVVGASGRWYVKVDQQPDIATSHPAEAVNRDINAFLPQGADATKWRQLQNEIQMLLFSHPVNQMREQSGLPVCNSLWFWGGGSFPSVAQHQVAMIHGESALLKGLASLAYVRLQGAEEMTESGPTDTTWLELNAAQLEDDYFDLLAPVLKADRTGDLQIHFAVGPKVLRSRLRRYDAYKFWRRKSPLSSYLKDADANGY